MTGAPLTVSDGRHLLGKITELSPKKIEARDPAGALVGVFGSRREAVAALAKPPAREGAGR